MNRTFLQIASMVIGCVAATATMAEPAKLAVDFGFFPSGTECKVFGTTGRVTLRTGREIKYKIKGDTSDVSFLCTQPDVRKFSVQTGPLLPPGSFSLVSIQINQDDHAHVFWDEGGIRKSTTPGVLNWK